MFRIVNVERKRHLFYYIDLQKKIRIELVLINFFFFLWKEKTTLNFMNTK